MKNNSNDYHISFFKPTTPRARSNRNIVISLVGLWAVAIFGFQVLLRIMEKPTPEPEYKNFTEVWESIEDGSATFVEMQSFAKSNLYVLSKVFIGAEDQKTLDKYLNYTIFMLSDENNRTAIESQITKLSELRKNIETLQDPEYLQSKAQLSSLVGEIIALQASDVRSNILPLELHPDLFVDTKPTEDLSPIMAKYLIHNRSALTDFKFLGFPFHYFYTAVFLLILFVFLCWLYCVRIDKFEARIQEETAIN